MSDPEKLAKRFHELYEQLASNHGYETRKESNKPWEEVPENNKALMIDVCEHIIEEFSIKNTRTIHCRVCDYEMEV
jgi:trehalose-6-phosphatase